MAATRISAGKTRWWSVTYQGGRVVECLARFDGQAWPSEEQVAGAVERATGQWTRPRLVALRPGEAIYECAPRA